MRGNDLKEKEGKFRSSARKKCFTMWVMGHWEMLPQKVVNVLLLKVFKGSLDEHPPGLVEGASKVPFQRKLFSIGSHNF